MQEQNLPTPTGPETLPTPIENSPSGGESVTPTPESQPSRPEVGSVVADSVNQAAPIMPALDLPQPITTVAPQATDDPVVDAPTVADDVDVIEKVWVDKAKSIVKETKQDPYEQERKVSILQTDYQQKRYGNEPKQQM